MPKGRSLGYMDSRLAPTKHPTMLDIAWAAGIYEGEGTCTRVHYNSALVSVTQSKLWLLERLKDLFGGSVSTTYRSGMTHISKGQVYNRADQSQWFITGTRARGFLMTVYSFMSPHRKEQIKEALTSLRKPEIQEVTKTKLILEDDQTDFI